MMDDYSNPYAGAQLLPDSSGASPTDPNYVAQLLAGGGSGAIGGPGLQLHGAQLPTAPGSALVAPSTLGTAPLVAKDAPSWWDRFSAGGKKEQTQGLMGMTALQLLGAYLQSRKSGGPGSKTLAQMRAEAQTPGYNGNPTASAGYFAAPASQFLRPTPIASYATGGLTSLVHGAGGGQDDKVHARLSPGEYVIDADTVSALGDGSSDAGAALLDRFRQQIRAHKRSAPADDIPPKAQSPLHYLGAATGKGK